MKGKKCKPPSLELNRYRWGYSRISYHIIPHLCLQRPPMLTQSTLLLLVIIDAGYEVPGVAPDLDDGGAHVGLALAAPVIHTEAVTVKRSVVRGGSEKKENFKKLLFGSDRSSRNANVCAYLSVRALQRALEYLDPSFLLRLNLLSL